MRSARKGMVVSAPERSRKRPSAFVVRAPLTQHMGLYGPHPGNTGTDHLSDLPSRVDAPMAEGAQDCD